ncbi:MAG TPA: hypothetical protein VGE07_05710 [Herpetosiphonaceae bacterium]
MVERGLLAEAPPVLAETLAALRDRSDWRSAPEHLSQIARLLLRIDQRELAEAVLAESLEALHALRPVGDETREIRQALAGAGAWPEALALAHREPSLADQSIALLSLARRAAADAPPETLHAVLADAVAIALRIESAADQLSRLCGLAPLLERAGEQELLARLADGCQVAARRGAPSANLREAAAAADLLARYLGLEPALAWAREQPARFLPSCLAGIAHAAREGGAPERARELLRQAAAAGASLRPEDRETNVIVKGLAWLAALAEAQTLARAQDNPLAVIGALVEIRDNAWLALDAPQRAALLAELRERAGRLTDSWELSRVAYSLARDVASAGDFAGAEALLEQIEDEERRSDAADQVAKMLRIAGDFAAARRFADLITSPGHLIQALKEIGLALAAAAPDQARTLADELLAFAEGQDESQQDHALSAAATLLARLGLADEALAAARRAEAPDYRSWGLLAAAEILVGAEAGRGLEALDEVYAVTIANNVHRDYILGQLLHQLLARDESGRALAAVRAIRFSQSFVQGMAELLAAFPEKRAELAEIAESRLAQTATRRDALGLMPALLLLNPGAPEFRQACERGMDWVAAQGLGGAR